MKSFWYYPPKDGQKYALVGCSGWNEANSSIEFDELAFTQDDSFFHVFAYATVFKEITNFNNKDWKFEPQLIQFKIAKKDYEKQDKEKKTVKVEQSRLEKFLCHFLSQLEESKIYKGFIQLKDDPSCDFLLTREWAGKPLSDEVYSQMIAMSINLEKITDPPIYINLEEDVKTPSGKSGWGKGGGYAKGQTEGEKLADRLAFVLSQINELSEIKCSSLAQMYSLMDESSPIANEVEAVFNLCTKLMV